MRRILWDIIINRLFATRLIPEGYRWRLYRLAGFDFGRVAIAPGAWLSPNRPKIVVGDGTYFNRGLVVTDARRVTIGEGCSFGPQVMIAGRSHAIGPPERRAGASAKGTVTIGDGCWIGARAVILAGTTIGSGSIVAAGAVVIGNLKPNGLYAGVPALPKRDLPF